MGKINHDVVWLCDYHVIMAVFVITIPLCLPIMGYSW